MNIKERLRQAPFVSSSVPLLPSPSHEYIPTMKQIISIRHKQIAGLNRETNLKNFQAVNFFKTRASLVILQAILNFPPLAICLQREDKPRRRIFSQKVKSGQESFHTDYWRVTYIGILKSCTLMKSQDSRNCLYSCILRLCSSIAFVLSCNAINI